MNRGTLYTVVSCSALLRPSKLNFSAKEGMLLDMPLNERITVNAASMRTCIASLLLRSWASSVCSSFEARPLPL